MMIIMDTFCASSQNEPQASKDRLAGFRPKTVKSASEVSEVSEVTSQCCEKMSVEFPLHSI